MFGFFGKSKKKRSQRQQQRVQRQVAPNESDFIGGTKIRYEPQLISEFKNEHQILLDRFGKIKLAVEREKVVDIKQSLLMFAKVLRGHLLKENLKLYVYLAHAVVGDKANSDLVLTYKREMQGIGKVVNDFVTKYSTIDLNQAEINEMAEQLSQIEGVLVERISNEESVLYPLYMHPRSYN